MLTISPCGPDTPGPPGSPSRPYHEDTIINDEYHCVSRYLQIFLYLQRHQALH